MLPIKAPRDPAPSRIKYRLERLWLRPAIRNSVRIGLPCLAAAGILASIATDPTVQAAVRDQVLALRETIATHPGLLVTRVEIEGVDDEFTPAVRAAMDVTVPVSSIDLDLADLQRRVAGLDAVASANVRVDSGGVLRVTLTERVPRILWRTEDGLSMLDATGIRVGSLPDREARADLPVIAGQGADKAVPEALRLLGIAAPVAPELRGLVRVGERRWNLVLANGIEIMLPEEGAASALARVMALDSAEEILSRDLVAVDMRDGRRPILRLTPDALLELRRRRGLIGEDNA